MTLEEFWPKCLRKLHDIVPAQLFKQWIEPSTVGQENGAWVIYGKNQFACNALLRFAEKIDSIREELAPNSTGFIIKVGVGQRYAMAAEDSAITVSDTSISESVAKENKNIVPASDTLTSTTDEERDTVALVSEPLKLESEEVETREPTTLTKTALEIVAERINNLKTDSTHSEASSTEKPSSKTADNKTQAKSGNDERNKAEEARYNATNLSADYTFETLVEGKGNRIAAAAAQSIAENPGKSYNPFFLYGSTGLGKTHLVQAIGNKLLKDKPDAKVRYMHADDYIRSFMVAVRNNSYDVFKQQYKQYDLLIIDDIQFIKGKDRTMEEFFYLYNHFHNEKKQLILTCDVLPTKIDDMDDRLKSRFSWGLTLELEPPELEMRVAILQKKAEADGVNLTEDAAFFIANLIRSNVRELEGAFNRVRASGRFLNKPIDIDLAREALQDIIAEKHKVITVDLIIDATAKYYRIKTSDILGKKRTRNIARPRQVAMSLTKELTNLSLPSIGDAFGGRDHTTVMHGVKAVAKFREEDPELGQDYEKLLVMIQN